MASDAEVMDDGVVRGVFARRFSASVKADRSWNYFGWVGGKWRWLGSDGDGCRA